MLRHGKKIKGYSNLLINKYYRKGGFYIMNANSKIINLILGASVLLSLLFSKEILSQVQQEKVNDFSNFTVYRNININDGEVKILLDLIVPKKRNLEKIPCVMWIHGGGWKEGGKGRMIKHASEMAAEGNYVLADINYRLTGEAPFPAQIDDCRLAIKWLKKNADKYHIDPERIGVWGHSAGGHLALLLGVAPETKENRVKAVCALSPITDIANMIKNPQGRQKEEVNGFNSSFSMLLGGNPSTLIDKAIEASPITYISSNNSDNFPLLLLIHGENDPLIPISYTEKFHTEFKKLGGNSWLLKVPNAKHSVEEVWNLDLVKAFFDMTLYENETLFKNMILEDNNSIIKLKAFKKMSEEKYSYSSPQMVEVNNQITKLQFRISKKEAFPINRGINSFNNQIVGKNIDMQSLDYINAVKELKPKFFRFPGGSIGNFYRWQSDDFNIPEFVLNDTPATMKNWVTMGVNQSNRKKQKYYEPYVKLLKETRTNPLLMLSIIHNTPASTVELLKKFNKDGISIKYVELGNEVYFKGHRDERTKNVEGYINVCRPIYQAIKKYDKQIKVGAVVGSLNKRGRWETTWNAQLIKSNKEDAFCDAIIYHDYVGGDVLDINGQDNIEKSDLLFPEVNLRKELSILKRTTDNMPLWYTEWNISPSILQQKLQPTLQSLFIASYMIELSRHAEVQLACYHQFIDYNRQMFAPILKDQNAYSKTALYPVFYILGNLFSEAIMGHPLDINKIENADHTYNPIIGNAIWGDKQLFLIIVNRSPQKVLVDIIDEDNQISENGQLLYISGNSLDAVPILNEAISCKHNEISIHAFSINLIKYTIK